MGDLEKLLPVGITSVGVPFDSELCLPFDGAKVAVHLAAENSIAVLGVEVFEISGNSLAMETYSRYEFFRMGDWAKFVLLNNQAALRFIEENNFGEGFGYVLTSTSEREFDELPQ
jgi:hypothetical protein